MGRVRSLCLWVSAWSAWNSVDASFVNAPARFLLPRVKPCGCSCGSRRFASVPTAEEDTEISDKKKLDESILGLLTFDLDDTLYPIAPVIEEANAAFSRAMARFGYEGVSPREIVETGKRIRAEIGETDPEKAATLTHSEIRELAIREVMFHIILDRKLHAVADDWATQVSSLSSVVVQHAKQWTKNAISESVVQSILREWEMERHHAAERHLYPEVVEALKQIKQENPGCIIGAVTDGRANPLLMTFTLAPYFDFCMSWEDHQGGRKKFFQQLDSVGEEAELTWIYESARHKYATLKQANKAISAAMGGNEEPIEPLVYPDTYDDFCWIHVGDDLAFDVGGSAACGAKTILIELADKYGQTARHRFDNEAQPQWSVTPSKELKARLAMNEAAKDKVNVNLAFLSQLPDAVSDILNGKA